MSIISSLSVKFFYLIPKALIITALYFCSFCSYSNDFNVVAREFLTDTMLAEGFDFPVGDLNGKGSYISLGSNQEYDGWYVATKTGDEYTLGIHTGEDWNGTGGGDTDLGQPVFAIARGKVIFAGECPSPWGNVILIEHSFLENGKLKKVFSQYAHLKEILVKKGELILKRKKIGTIGKGNKDEYPAHLHLEIRKESLKDYPVDYWPSSNGKTVAWVKQQYEDVSHFIQQHRTHTVPAKVGKLVWVDKSDFKMYLYKKGVLYKTYEIALSQVPVGRKEKQGDLKVPEGEYKICEKSKGPFDASKNWSMEYLGLRWMKLNYPNVYDAETGLNNKRITKSEYTSICAAIKAGRVPPQSTALGGGIGIHGWIKSDWKNDGDRSLTWGCVSMHEKDLLELYDWIELKTIVIIQE